MKTSSMNLNRISVVWIAAIVQLVALAQMANAQNDTKYLTIFLDQPPSTTEMSRVPYDAKDVLVAKVRVVAPGSPDGTASNGAWELVVTSVLRGKAEVGGRYSVKFRDGFIVPFTKQQQAREYFIIGYIDPKLERQFLDFPVTKEKLHLYESEVRAALREKIQNQKYVRFFLDRAPTTQELTEAAKSASDIAIAKVKVDMVFSTNGHNDVIVLSDPPVSRKPRIKYGSLARLNILNVLRGNVANGSKLDVYFGSAEEIGTYPHLRDRDLEFFIVSYVGSISNISDDTGRILFGFPITRTEYESWSEKSSISIEDVKKMRRQFRQ